MCLHHQLILFLAISIFPSQASHLRGLSETNCFQFVDASLPSDAYRVPDHYECHFNCVTHISCIASLFDPNTSECALLPSLNIPLATVQQSDLLDNISRRPLILADATCDPASLSPLAHRTPTSTGFPLQTARPTDTPTETATFNGTTEEPSSPFTTAPDTASHHHTEITTSPSSSPAITATTQPTQPTMPLDSTTSEVSPSQEATTSGQTTLPLASNSVTTESTITPTTATATTAAQETTASSSGLESSSFGTDSVVTDTTEQTKTTATPNHSSDLLPAGSEGVVGSTSSSKASTQVASTSTKTATTTGALLASTRTTTKATTTTTTKATTTSTKATTSTTTTTASTTKATTTSTAKATTTTTTKATTTSTKATTSTTKTTASTTKATTSTAKATTSVAGECVVLPNWTEPIVKAATTVLGSAPTWMTQDPAGSLSIIYTEHIIKRPTGTALKTITPPH